MVSIDRRYFLVAFAVMAAMTLTAASHPHEYLVAGTADIVNYDPCRPADLGASGIGGACIEAGHAVANPSGKLTVLVSDGVTNPVSAQYCQNTNTDFLCGGSGEPIIHFCASLTLQEHDNWDPAYDIIVLVDGPLFGNPATTPCIPLTASFGVANGDVFHNP